MATDTELRTLRFVVEIDTYDARTKHDENRIRTLCQAIHMQFPMWRVFTEDGREVDYDALAHGGSGSVEIRGTKKKRRWWESRG